MIDFLSIQVPENEEAATPPATSATTTSSTNQEVALVQYSCLSSASELELFFAYSDEETVVPPFALTPSVKPVAESLYQFLKRAGVGGNYNNFLARGITTVRKLYKWSANQSRITVYSALINTSFCLTKEEANRLSDILTHTAGESGHLRNFDLVSSAQVRNIFSLFYADPCGEVTMCADGSLHFIPAHPSPPVHRVVRCDPAQLERLAHRYADSVRKASESESLSVIGSSPVTSSALPISAIEVLVHLDRYRSDPHRAVETVLDELLYPPPPPPSLTIQNDETESGTIDFSDWTWEGLGGIATHQSTTDFSVTRSTSSAEACLQVNLKDDEHTRDNMGNDLLGTLASNMLDAIMFK